MNSVILLISISACLVFGKGGGKGDEADEVCKHGDVKNLEPHLKMECNDGTWIPKEKKGRNAQGPPVPCEDNPSLAANGTCAKEKSNCLQYTVKGEETNLNCAGTCNACDTCRCQDHAQWHTYCPYWSKYCNSLGVLGTWMSSNCRKSCHKCSCKCCSYQGKQHSLGAKILLPEKCSILECREGIPDGSSPLIPGAASHKIQHPEELTFEFVTLFDGAECCVLTGDGLGEDGIRYPNGSIIPEGWKGIMEKDNGAWINVTCCHGLLCVALSDVASVYSTTTPTTTTPTTTTPTTSTTTATTSTTTPTTTTTTTATTTTTTTTTATTTTTTIRPNPISSWSFDNNLEDSIGDLHGFAVGSARLQNGALILDGGGYVKTANLKAVLNVKTLEAWVLLENHDPTGGGVITVASGRGSDFDSIVWSEGHTHSGMWLAGSYYYVRTQAFGGLKETQSVAAGADTPVHLVMVYQGDGTITCYRNGLLYGTPYTKPGPINFDQNAYVLFGLRHLPNQGYSKARLYQASLYNVALTPREVTSLYYNGYN